MRDSLVDMPNNQDIVWYTDGQYQGGTQRGCDSVNLFDPDTNVIAVYQKQPDGSRLFLTTCKLVPAEINHLQDSNGNFLTENNIGNVLATRDLMSDLRSSDPFLKGKNKPYSKADRSKFLTSLENLI